MIMRLLLAMLMSLGVTHSAAGELMVFAAASLMDALKESGAAFERSSGTKVRFSFTASSILARQIQEGAPADLFLSADEAKMDLLQEKGLIEPGTRKPLLSNSLVVVIANDSNLQLPAPRDLKKAKRIAIAEPNTVPAGIYARKILQEMNLWGQLRDRLVPTVNVRAALAALEAGNVDAAIIYKTDATTSRRVQIACELSGSAPITYPIAILKDSTSKTEARRFQEWLASDRSRQIFERFGFILIPSRSKFP